MSIEQATNPKNLSAVEKHPLAFMVILLFCAVGFLFYLFVDLNKDFREHLTTANRVMIEALQESTETLKQSKEALDQYAK